MKCAKEDGFSYVDVIIALVLLMIAILGMLSTLVASIIQTRGHEQQMQAKHVASSTMESIMSVKETDPDRLGWNAIGNIGANPDGNGVGQGIFLHGFQPVLTSAGPDEVIGTADDSGSAVPGLTRKITIVDVCDPSRPSTACAPPGPMATRIRSVTVEIRYSVGGIQRDETIVTVLTDYAVNN